MAVFKRWQYLSPIDCFIPSQYARQSLCFPTRGPSPVLALREGLQKTVLSIPQLSTNIIPSSSSLSHDLLPHTSYDINKFVLSNPEYHDITDIFSEGPPELVQDLEYTRLDRAGFPNNLLNKDVFLPPLPHFPASDGPAPAFRARVTQIPGGTVVSICVHHSLTDLGGIYNILKTWAYFCKQSYKEDNPCRVGAPSATEPPSMPAGDCDRRRVFGSVLDGHGHPRKEPTLPAGIHLLDAIPPVLTSDLMAQLPLETAHFRISTPVIQSLKARAQQHLPAEMRISSNDLISAMMWSATTSATTNASSTQDGLADPEAEDTVSMGLSVDMRRRLMPPIPDNFIGNVLAMAWPTVSRHLLLDAASDSGPSSSSFSSLAQVASHISSSHQALDEAYFQNFVTYLDCHKEDMAKLQWGPGPSKVNMVASIWRGFRVDSLDWGSEIGECQAVRTRLPFPHTITILPQMAGDEGIDVVYCLLAPTMERLKSCQIIKEFWQVRDD
ncbi:uncharacterized protein PG998_010122 [Apiospora kogelbergensis]|uniref:uncharacterized protein n=1 Tax=Apiospora kogelbergensis TaxID=1337665 RepID=UPI00312F7F68